MKRIFPSLPENAGLSEVFQAFPITIAPLLEYHDRLLRGPSDLSIAERELIAAYTSGLNACQFCTGAHLIYAKAFGIDAATIEAALDDLESSQLPPKIKPLLAYVTKLTESPSRITEADAQAVYAQGWSEAALFDAIQTCALFNFMNRIVEGSGIAAYPQDMDSLSADDLAARRTRSYTDWGREIGVIKD